MEGADGPKLEGMERLTGVLEGVDLHVQQRKGLSEAVCHRGLLLLEDLCHLRGGREGGTSGEEKRLEGRKRWRTPELRGSEESVFF